MQGERIQEGDRDASHDHPTLSVLVSGSSGLVGRRLCARLEQAGHRVGRLLRNGRPGPSDALWDPGAGRGPADLPDVDAVVHLAGESIASGRWTARKMAAIRSSRVEGTHLLSEALARSPAPPRVLLCASAIGYYGDRGSEALDESSASGDGFLAEVCRAWEAACAPAREAGIRVVHLRLGVVLASEGGALAKMLPPFKLGLGGRIGSGEQVMSWIALEDVVGAVEHLVVHEGVEGPVNLVAPAPVTNREFTRVLGRVLGRPTIAPLPAPIARLVLGKMADELLLASTRVLPKALVASGYRFAFSDLEAALRAQLDEA